MKKLSAILIALVLVAATAVTAFAAGINSSEQAVLDELGTSVTMKDGEMVISDAYINQAENYFNTIDMTAEESSQIIAIIKEGESFLENSGAANIDGLTYAQKQQLLDYGVKVVGVIDMTMTYDFATKTLIIKDPDGKVAFSASPYLVKVGGGTITENPIKTTGLDVNYFGFIVLGAAMLLVAGGAVYFVNAKKERA